MFRQIAIAAVLIAASAAAAAASGQPRQAPVSLANAGQQAKAPTLEPAETAPPLNVNDDDSEFAEAETDAAPPTAPVKAQQPAKGNPPPAPRKISAPPKPACKPAVAIVRGKRIAYCVPVRR